MTLTTIVSVVAFSLLCLLTLGSLLNLSSNPHWFIRGWDFPRVQIMLIGWCLALIAAFVHYAGDSDSVMPLWPLFAVAVVLTCWHGFLVYPYTLVASTQSKSTDADQVRGHREDASTIRVVISNVEMENDQYDRWMKTIRSVDPDVLIVLESDHAWVDAIKPLTNDFKYHVSVPQDNWYGMMMLSRLPIESHEVRYLIQADVPSIDAQVRLDDGSLIRVVAVHPRPPEPIRGNDATARDAELALWGVELEQDEGPIIIGGDLNDVAWSQTTRLFLRTSGLLDPRRGRGFFNTFHADHFYMRFPLDHIFHSPHFTISGIRRLAYVGSDHFPMLIDLKRDPSEKDEHEVLEEKKSDDSEIEMRLDRADDDTSMRGETS